MKINVRIRFKLNFIHYLYNKWIFFFICCGIYYGGLNYLPHDKPTTMKCEILERYGKEHTHKSHIYTDFILVVKSNNKIFDVEVEPSTYYLAGQKKYMYLNLTPRMINGKNTYKDIFYILFMILYGFFLLVFLSANIAGSIEE